MSEGAEKSFAPSEKRRREAARKGDVLRSREVASAVAVLAGAAWLRFQGPDLLAGLEQVARLGLVWDRQQIEHFSPGRLLNPILLAILPPVLSLAGLVLTITLASQLVLGEGRFNGANMAPRASRIDPLAGLRRMFGPHGWIEMVKGLAKVSLLGAIAWGWARSSLASLSGVAHGELAAQLVLAWDALVSLAFALSAGLVAIALIDLPVQAWRRQQRLRMSHQELRDEHKEAEGSPENRAARRRRQREIAMGGMQAAMREAQFVLTNPAHFAVALAYDPARAAAPVVLARGRGEQALAIRELAAELALPVLEYPVLARSLYFTTRERQMIREELYATVAAVLAFVLSLKRAERPEPPRIVVPVALRFDAEGRPDPAAAR